MSLTLNHLVLKMSSDNKPPCSTDANFAADSREDAKRYTGDSVALVLASPHGGLNDDDTYYRYEDLSPPVADKDYFNREERKPEVGCYFCCQKITHYTGCYIFCQNERMADANIEHVACSDACPIGLLTQKTTKCDSCCRTYLPEFWSGNICCLCSYEQRTNGNC